MTTKEVFKQEYENIFRFHRAGGSGIDVAMELTKLVDRSLTALFEILPHEFQINCSIVGLGGYGRCEMSPHSDVDVMILFADEQTKIKYVEQSQKYLHSLWDLGFDVGHSVRTISDCLNLYQTDVDVWASVLESRYICGNKHLVEQYAKRMMETIEKKHDLKFIIAVIAGVDERHVKYEHSIKLLEPNLKNSAGGVRDLHSLLWIYRVSNNTYFGDSPFFFEQSSCVLLFEQFFLNGIVPKDEFDELRNAFDFLLRIRHETHYTANNQQDILEFSKQHEIARNLGYKSDDPIRSVEQCMRQYFLHARTIYRLNRRLINQFRRHASSPFWSRSKEQILDEYFVARNGQINVRNTSLEISTPIPIVKAFYWCGFHSLELSPALQARFDSLSRDAKIFISNVEHDKEIAKIILEILRLPANVADTLQSMNECDILGKIIPEWGNLVAFFQHSMYHYYTTDAHTLIALEHAEKLHSGKNILSNVFRSLPNKEILFLAILFHDIAKPSGVSEHEIRGVGIWKKIQHRFGFTDEQDHVAFLIREHLVMEQIAFRRNTNDNATIDEFAKLFISPEQFDLLFILTYADLSAVNKSVWTSWKEMLLQELYLKTRNRISQHDVPEHAESSSPYSEKEIQEIESIIPSLETVSVLFKHEEGHSSVFVVTRDAPFLLSQLCGVLSANDVSIFDARIFTRTGGIVIDSFRVYNSATKQPLTQQQEITIQRDLNDVLSHSESLEVLFEKHHRRWKRRSKPLFHPNIKIDTVFFDSKKHTIIDVYAPDMVGFLYKITQTISKCGVQILFAKLATRGDGIVDSFTVANSDGTLITEDQKKMLREKILHTIDQLMNVQLGV